MTLFDPLLSVPVQQSKLQVIDAQFVRSHAVLFSQKSLDQFEPAAKEYLSLLDNQIGRTTKRWLENGYYIGIALGCSLFEYGSEENLLVKLSKPQRADDDQPMEGLTEPQTPSKRLNDALSLSMRTHNIVLRRFGDPNVLPYVHTTMALMLYLAAHPTAMDYLELSTWLFPWKLLSLFLNTLVLSQPNFKRIEGEAFPTPTGKELPRPLPEDHAMKGLLYAEDYYPPTWFSGGRVDDDEKHIELPSMTDERKERLLWIGCRIASYRRWLLYDANTRTFSVAEQWEMALDNDGLPTAAAPPSSAGDGGTKSAAAVAPAPVEDEELPDAPSVASTATSAL